MKIKKKTMTVTTSASGNASVVLPFDECVVISVIAVGGGIICTPYYFSIDKKQLGFHAVLEAYPNEAYKDESFDVNVYYASL